MEADALLVAESAGMAAMYSLLVYSRKYSLDAETFRPYKFAATLAVGIAVGVGMGLAGENVTQAEVFARLTALTGTIVLVENVVKLLWRQAQSVSTNR